MRFFALSLFLICLKATAANKDSAIVYNLPDSIRGVSFIADVNVSSAGPKKVYAGLATKHVRLVLEKKKRKAEVSFEFPSLAHIITTGLHTEKERGKIEWKFNWQFNATYKLLVVTAVDTAENFSLHSGYIYLPDEQKWKLIGTCRINGERLPLTDLKAVKSTGKKNSVDVLFSNVMVQPATGLWRRLDDLQAAAPPPFLSNVDSTEQFSIDKNIIESAIASGITDVAQNIEGVYYKIINAGTGEHFTVNDSITAKYQLRIFGTSEVISGSETETYTFLLKGLIKAWQLAVPLIQIGGKIKLVIPSGLAYSIRTRAPKIPPNSILEFYVEVLDTKPNSK